MIYVPAELPLDAACQNPGEEMQSEHEGHVWMISQPQLPAATSGRHKALGSWRNKKSCLYRTDEPHKAGMPR